jgi:MFS family permease
LPWGAYQRTHKSDPCDCLIDDSSALAGSAGRRTARVVLGIYIKNHDPRQWGLWEFVLAAANFGTLLGGLVATVLRDNLTDEQLASWGWRLPFLSGIVVSFSGFYLRSHGDPEHVPAGHVPVDTNTEAEDHSDEDDFANATPQAREVASSPPPVNPLR